LWPRYTSRCPGRLSGYIHSALCVSLFAESTCRRRNNVLNINVGVLAPVAKIFGKPLEASQISYVIFHSDT